MTVPTSGDDLVPAAAARRGRDDLVPRHGGDDRSHLLDGLRAGLRGITWLSPLPVGRARVLWVLPRRAGRATAEIYVAAWVAGLVACMVFASTDAGPYVAGIALFRYGDLVATQATVLLDPVGARVGDPRRALALAGFHVAELALVAGTVSRWRLDHSLGAAFMSGFDVVTLRAPGGHPGNWLDAARVLGGAGVALVALRIVVSLVRVARER